MCHLPFTFSPNFDLPVMDSTQTQRRVTVTCHYCHETGHKAVHCHKLSLPSKHEVRLLKGQNCY